MAIVEGVPDTRTFRAIVENRSHLTRSIQDCQREWGKEEYVFHSTFDDLILQQLINAKQSGNSIVTVLDIGTSWEGGLLLDCAKQFSSVLRPKDVPESKSFLDKNPEMRLRILGFTDASRVEHFLDAESVLPSTWNIRQKPNPQVEITRIGYSLTFNQSLSKFLDSQAISPWGSLNLVLSTQVLLYLHPRLMEMVLEDTVNALAPGGKFVGYGYSGKATTDISRNSPPGFNNSVGFFDRFLKRQMAYNTGNFDSDQEIERNCQVLWDRIRSIRFQGRFVLEKETIDEFTELIKELPPRQKFIFLTGTAMYTVKDRLKYMLIDYIGADKTARLFELMERYKKVTEMNLYGQIIVIDKK